MTPACPEGYEYGAYANWEGIYEGCNCVNSIRDIYPDIDKGGCSMNQTD